MNNSLDEFTIDQLLEELNKRRKQELTKDILITIAKTSFLAFAIILAPNAVGAICKTIYKSTQDDRYRKDKRKIRSILYRLRRQEVVDFQKDKEGQIILTLTDNGKKRVLKYQLNQLKIKPLKTWDDQWRVIIFDIPEAERRGRDELRRKMKELGCYPLQKSVWIYPYPCKDEIDFIANFFGIGKYLLYFETSHLENEQFLRDYFRLDLA